MKVRDTVKNYESERRMYANYVFRSIKKLCKEVGPRCAGSPEELKAQEIMAEDLKATCDDVRLESFTVHPGAFMAWIRIMVVCGCTAGLLVFASMFFAAFAIPMIIAAIALILISFFFCVSEFLFYKPTIDPFTKKATSHNLVGIKKPSGEVKRRIIFAGHADSAPEWRFTYWGGHKLVVGITASSLLGVLAVLIFCVVDLVFVFTGNFEGNMIVKVFSIITICLEPLFLSCILYYNPKKYVEGANDNLTGCFIAMAMPRYLNDHGISLENTEVWALCTGSEEAGLRGSKAFAQTYAQQFKVEKDVETVFVAVDTIRDFEHMTIYNKDMTGLINNDAQACDLVKAGAKLAGYDVGYKAVSLGATDAAAASQAGIKATAFAAMDPAPARYYHTRLDTHENMDLKTIEAAVDICLNTMFLFDENGIDA